MVDSWRMKPNTWPFVLQQASKVIMCLCLINFQHKWGIKFLVKIAAWCLGTPLNFISAIRIHDVEWYQNGSSATKINWADLAEHLQIESAKSHGTWIYLQRNGQEKEQGKRKEFVFMWNKMCWMINSCLNLPYRKNFYGFKPSIRAMVMTSLSLPTIAVNVMCPPPNLFQNILRLHPNAHVGIYRTWNERSPFVGFAL